MMTQPQVSFGSNIPRDGSSLHRRRTNHRTIPTWICLGYAHSAGKHAFSLLLRLPAKFGAHALLGSGDAHLHRCVARVEQKIVAMHCGEFLLLCLRRHSKSASTRRRSATVEVIPSITLNVCEAKWRAVVRRPQRSGNTHGASEGRSERSALNSCQSVLQQQFMRSQSG
jgi:hypothetical protein